MEHLRRILPAIRNMYGLPGVLSSTTIARLYSQFLGESMEKYKIAMENVSFEDIPEKIQNGFMLVTRPHLPQSIINQISNHFLDLYEYKGLSKMDGIYVYSLQNCSHIPAITEDCKRQVQIFFEESYSGLICLVTANVNIFKDISHMDSGEKARFFRVLVRNKRYKMIEFYEKIMANKLAFPLSTIPFEWVLDYAQYGQKHIIHTFATETKIGMRLQSVISSINAQLSLNLKKFLPVFLPKEKFHVSKFTFNSDVYNLTDVENLKFLTSETAKLDLSRRPELKKSHKEHEMNSFENLELLIYLAEEHPIPYESTWKILRMNSFNFFVFICVVVPVYSLSLEPLKN